MPRPRRPGAARIASSSAPGGQLQARLVSAREDAELRELIARYEGLVDNWERLAQRAFVLLARRS